MPEDKNALQQILNQNSALAAKNTELVKLVKQLTVRQDSLQKEINAVKAGLGNKIDRTAAATKAELQSALAGRTNTADTASKADITTLQNALARKIDVADAASKNDVTILKAKVKKSVICGYRSHWNSPHVAPGKWRGGTITYNNVHTEVNDVGSVLDAKTGIYTVGITGVYEVSASGRCDVDPGEGIHVHLKGATAYDSENRDFIWSSNEPKDNNSFVRDTCAQTRYMKLTAGQRIYLDYFDDSQVSKARTGKNYGDGFANFYHIKFCVSLY